MTRVQEHAAGRRVFLAASLLVGCTRRSDAPAPRETAPREAAPPAAALAPSTSALFEAFPALAKNLPRIEMGRFPSAVEPAQHLLGEGRLWIKRDDDFTRAPSWDPGFALARTYGGGKVRKLELYLGDARAKGKRTLVTFGGVGSNQAVAAALLGRALGFAVRLYLAPQPPSLLTTRNLGADSASQADMRLFESVAQAQAEAEREATRNDDLYLVPPGGTTPLGTLGFVSAGLELAADVRAGRLPAPRRIYVALGLGGTAAGLGIGCAAGGLATEIVAVRASNPATVLPSTLRAIHDATVAFARSRDPSFPALTFEGARVRIDGRFVGAGYGVPTAAGNDAVARARAAEGWDLEPVYTGKALAALLADDDGGALGPTLFWNTASSRPLALAAVSPPFQRFAR